jgi:DNA-binding MarR family transcriptional regulator
MSNMKKDESLPFDRDYQLWLLLSQTRSALFKAREEKIGQYLHPNQATALIAIWAGNGQATPAILARSLFLERHTVSELISRMEEKGLVVKTRDEKRRNIVRIRITDKGRQVGYKVIQIDFVRNIMSNLTEEQKEQLQTSLKILLQSALKEMEKKNKNSMDARGSSLLNSIKENSSKS